MEPNYEYKYDDTNGILFKIYYNNISFETLKESWEHAFKNNVIPEGTKKFVLDYRETDIVMSADDVPKILEFYKKHIDIFQNAKVAIIIEEPDQSIIPMLFHIEEKDYITKPFHTVKSAVEWLIFE